MAVPEIDEPLGAEVVTVADWEQLGAVWEKSVATAVTVTDAW